MEKKVSIVIPCFNNEEEVSRAIESGLSQTYKNLDIVVVDDGSTDKSLEVIRSYENKVRWVTQDNQGAPAARNAGLKISEGEYVKFLDADDELLQNAIEWQVGASESIATERSVVYGNTLVADSQGNTIYEHSQRDRAGNQDPLLHILSHSPLTASPLHRREYLSQVGGFDERLRREQEYDLHIRLVLKAGVDFVHIDKPVYVWYQSDKDGRIGQKGIAGTGIQEQYDALRRRTNMILNNYSASDDLRARLAKMYWASGRALLREGYEEQAERFFGAAYEIHGSRCVRGRKPYAVLVRLFGPFLAERISTQLKKWMQRFWI